MPAVFTAAGQLGFDGVELDWLAPDEALDGGPLAVEGRAALRAAARAVGVEIPSVCAHFLDELSLASPDAGTRQRGQEGIQLGLSLCQDMGAGVLLVPDFGPALTEPAGAGRLVGHLRQLAPEAAARGVHIALEHTLPADEAVALYEAVGSPWVGDYWDMGNAMAFGYDPVREVRALGRRLVQVHAKEFDRGGGQTGARRAPRYDGLNRVPLGRGQVPVGDVLAQLARVGFDGYVVLETGAFGDAEASARAALDILHAARRRAETRVR